MKKIILCISLIIILVSCSSVLLTGRKQLNLVSDTEISSMSLQSYNEFMSTATVSKDTKDAALLKKVGDRLTAAVATYYRQIGRESELSKYNWQYTLVTSNEVNAFCLPGGQIVFYEGILPYTQNEAGIATVMGHEIAHALAKHSSERVSQQMLLSYGSELTNALTQNKSAVTQNAISTLYGLGAQVGVSLPFSRTQEYEADELGLIFMAMAGYDPNEAVNFWQRMAQSKSGSTIELLSTHPNDANRIAKIREQLPEALKYYKP